MISLKQMKAFVTVVELGSISRASVALALAQPALTRQIQAIEAQVKAPLLYRNGRGVVATEAGKLFAAHAKEILGTYSATLQEIAALAEAPSGEVVIGFPPTVGAILATPLVKRIRSQFPNVSLGIVEAFSGYVTEWLATGRLDVAVLYGTLHPQIGTTEHLVTEELVVAGPAADPAGLGRRRVTGQDLTRLPLILPSRAHGLRRVVEAYIAENALEIAIVVEVDSLTTILSLVEAGLGYTLLPYVSIAHLVAQGSLRSWAFAAPGPSRELVLATSAVRAMTPLTRTLAAMVKSEIADMIAQGKWSSP